MNNIKRNPGALEIEAQYRPIPFWSWNDKLEDDELIRQIHEMHDSGNGGFFMHARGGLKIEYMGPEWMHAVCVCVREAVKLGMKPWLYDENGWPSGFGSGEVNGLGEEYQSKRVELIPVSKLTGDSRILAWYDASGVRIGQKSGAAYAAVLFINPFYVDNLNPAVVGEFIRRIYVRYWEELPVDVREGMCGIFTDEPQLFKDGIPWSPALVEEYRSACGKELLDDFPELVLEKGSWRRTRLIFWRTVTTLFRDSYIDQIGDWCRAHNWILTGHHQMEESYDSQLNTGGAIMPQYEGYSLPGIDHLRYVSAYTTAEMQVVSAAAQNGQKQILSESFGGTGWNFNIRGMKWIYQQQLVLGANLLCQHLAGYSLHGLRKRDWPPSVSYQHPMFPHVRKLYDAFSRVGRMIALGETECEVLMLHGQSSAWIRSHGHFQDRFSKDLFRPFCRLSHAFNAAGMPCHYGDEIMIAKLGGVENGRLRVGEMSYSAVVVPPIENLFGSTVALLREFVKQGGKIVRLASDAVNGFFVDGVEPSAEDQSFYDAIPVCRSEAEIIAFLSTLPVLHIEALDGMPGRVRGTWRSFPETQERWYYIADFANAPENEIADEDFWVILYTNTPEVETGTQLQITLPFPAQQAEIIDQETGQVVETLELHTRPNGKSTFLKNLPASGSLFIRAKDAPVPPPSRDLTAQWKCCCIDNVMTLEKVVYRYRDSEPWQPETDTISLFNRMLGLKADTPLQIGYDFTLLPELDLAAADLKLAIEPDTQAQYFLNGTEIAPDFMPGFFLDRSIRILRLPPSALRSGTNRFEIRTFFRQSPEVRTAIERAKHFESEANKLYYDSEIEAVYLLGNFGCYRKGTVRKEKANSCYLGGPFVVGPMPETVDSGCTVLQGFPFFTGKMVLEKVIELTKEEAAGFTRLSWSHVKANAIQVTVNGRAFPVCFAPPYEVNVSHLLKEGKNQIALLLETSCRNTFGPFHTGETEPTGTSPGSFLTEPDLLGWFRPTNVPEYGVLEPSPEKVTLA